MRVLRPVGQFQLKFKCLGTGLRTISRTFLRPPAETHVLLLADGEIDLYRVDLGNGGERCSRCYKVSHLCRGNARYAIGEGADMCEIQADLGRLHGGFRRLHCCSGLPFIRGLGVQLALRNGSLLHERSIALHIDLREREMCLCLRQLRFRLIEIGLEGLRVDLKEDLVFVDVGSFTVKLLD